MYEKLRFRKEKHGHFNQFILARTISYSFLLVWCQDMPSMSSAFYFAMDFVQIWRVAKLFIWQILLGQFQGTCPFPCGLNPNVLWQVMDRGTFFDIEGVISKLGVQANPLLLQVPAVSLDREPSKFDTLRNVQINPIL